MARVARGVLRAYVGRGRGCPFLNGTALAARGQLGLASWGEPTTLNSLWHRAYRSTRRSRLWAFCVG